MVVVGEFWLNPLKHPYIAPKRSLPTVVNLQECSLLFLDPVQGKPQSLQKSPEACGCIFQGRESLSYFDPQAQNATFSALVVLIWVSLYLLFSLLKGN